MRHRTMVGAGGEIAQAAQAALISLQLTDAHPPETGDLVPETMFGRRVPGAGILDLSAPVTELDAVGSAAR
jgi:hypothetical protein